MLSPIPERMKMHSETNNETNVIIHVVYLFVRMHTGLQLTSLGRVLLLTRSGIHEEVNWIVDRRYVRDKFVLNPGVILMSFWHF